MMVRGARLLTGAWAASSVLALARSPASDLDPRRRDDTEVVVLVSRTEVQIRFDPDTASSWGWPAQPDPNHRARYYWFVIVDGAKGGDFLSLVVRQRDAAARSFATFADLVREGVVRQCRLGMGTNECRTSPALSVYVEDGRVVISLRDSAEIVRLFGLRPLSVQVLVDGRDLDAGEASVRYVDPQLPPLDSVQRAEVLRSRRRWASGIYSRSRGIIDEKGNGGLWVAVGDSLRLGIRESECLSDICGSFDASGDAPRTWGRWTLSDTTVARIHRTTNPQRFGEFYDDAARVMVLVGRRPGRTTVTATGVHTIADTMPSTTPVDTIVMRDVIVTPPIARVEITPRPSTMRVGETREVSVRVIDRAGRPVAGAPVLLYGGVPNISAVRDGTSPAPIRFDAPGRHGISAILGPFVDTLWVEVTGSMDRR